MMPDHAPDLPIVVLGATSLMAGDFVLEGVRRGLSFDLYARRPEAVMAFLGRHGLPEEWNMGDLSCLGDNGSRGVAGVVNFVGVGDPAKAKAMGAEIFEATRQTDKLALALLDRQPGLPYVFMSSGAVYGSGFMEPASPNSQSVFPVNRLSPPDYYGIAKLHAEAVHRSLHGRTIIDVRIFNYVSRHLDPSARFLITDMVRAIRDRSVFDTPNVPFFRDFLHPADLANLLVAALTAPTGTNRPIDAFSRAPVSKRELLEFMREEFGLNYRFCDKVANVDATGSKPFYYSTSRSAGELGYVPAHTSLEAIRDEIGAMLVKGD